MAKTMISFLFFTAMLIVISGVGVVAQADMPASASPEPAPVAASSSADLSFLETLPGMLPQKRSLAEEDERLHRIVTLVLRDAPVSDVLAKLTDLTAIKMSAHRDIQDRKVTLVVRGVPVISAMAQVGLLMGWGWQRTITGSEIAYRVQPQAGTRRRAQSMRDNMVSSSITEKATEEWRKMQPALDAWVESGGDIDAVRDVDPDMAQIIDRDPQLEYKLHELASMPSGARLNWIIGQIREDEEVRGPGVSYTIIEKQLTAKKSMFGSRDPAFTQKIDLALSGTSLSAALEALSKASHLNMIADSYSRKTSVGATEWTETPVNDILNTIANQSGYDWTQSGNFVRFRSRTWFLDELRDIPERLLKPFKDIKEKQGRLMFQDYVALVATLTDDQLDALSKADSENPLAADAALVLRYLPQFKFYAGLSTSQRTAAWSDHGLSMAEMTSSQKQSFLRLMAMNRRLTPPYWEQAIIFYVRQRGSQGYQIMFMFDVEQRMAWEQRIALPQGVRPAADGTDSTGAAGNTGVNSDVPTPGDEDSKEQQTVTQF